MPDCFVFRGGMKKYLVVAAWKNVGKGLCIDASIADVDILQKIR